jgi:hypothetical protein
MEFAEPALAEFTQKQLRNFAKEDGSLLIHSSGYLGSFMGCPGPKVGIHLNLIETQRTRARRFGAMAGPVQ